MTQMTMIMLISALGFVGSALVAYSGGLLSGDTGSYQISFDSIGSVVTGFLICMFAGAFITLEQSLAYWRNGMISGQALAFAALVSMTWSFCSGILIVQLLASLGVVAV